MTQDNRSSRFAFEKAVFTKFWLLLGGATFTVIGVIWQWQEWSRASLLFAEAVAAIVLFYLAARVAWKERTAQLAAENAKVGDLEAKLSNPQRTPAEQHDHDTAKEALKLTGGKGKAALRHLRKHGSLRFSYGTSSGPLPPGLNFNDTLWVYNHCASVGVVTCDEKYGSGEKIFSISPKMERALEELLFTEDGPTSVG